jgi:hypothetical protein
MSVWVCAMRIRAFQRVQVPAGNRSNRMKNPGRCAGSGGDSGRQSREPWCLNLLRAQSPAFRPGSITNVELCRASVYRLEPTPEQANAFA